MKHKKFILIFVAVIIFFSCTKNNEKTIKEVPPLQQEIEQINSADHSTEVERRNNVRLNESVDVDRPYNIEIGKYHVLASTVNIYNQPNLNGNIIGQLQLFDEIEVIENMGNEQRIDGFFQYWYKIKHRDLEGYIWGGYIGIETLVYDIDSNGINDYFSYRISGVIDSENLTNKINYKNKIVNAIIINGRNDIFIFINGRRLEFEFETRIVETRMKSWAIADRHIWNECTFFEPYYNEDWDQWEDLGVGFFIYVINEINAEVREGVSFYISSNGDISYGGHGGTSLNALRGDKP
ncbi:MAG: SH3 domain-containing protein [Treponema sp.]|jgi:hypothetical protein|nr:SH3 domain-containing protein [Treponema sp.]